MRQRRGEERRAHILRAALETIVAHGVGGVTHRTVAARAGVPLGSLTYYFSTKEDLLREALRLYVAEEVGRLEALGVELLGAELPPEEVAARFSEALEGSDPSQIAQFELYLEAAREPALRPAAQECLRAYARVTEIALRAAGIEHTGGAAALFVALADGLSLQRLAAPGAVPPLRDSLLALRRALVAPVEA